MAMKRIAVFFLLLLLLLPIGLTCVGAQETTYVQDLAGLLDASERAELETRLEQVSRQQGVTVAVVTVDTLSGKSATEYADDYFDYQGAALGWGEDGILLLVSMESHDWAISTTGKGIRIMTDSRLETMEEDVIPLLSKGRYAKAFDTFASDCERFSNKAFRFPLARNLLIALGIGLAVAGIVTLCMKSKLKTVRAQAAANPYIRKNSFQLIGSSDRFLYATVSRQARPQQSSGRTHTSSSGRSHGGSSGKF